MRHLNLTDYFVGVELIRITTEGAEEIQKASVRFARKKPSSISSLQEATLLWS
jgi:hypothetical protein